MIISGQIDASKRIEFEHTFRIGFSSISKDCLFKTLAEDRNSECLYYFLSIWASEKALKIFSESMEFQLLNGAFHALGKATRMNSGSVLDIPFNHFSTQDLKNDEFN